MYQKETVIAISNAFESGKRVIILEAPTGSGKSILNATFCGMWSSFYSTPQLALIDQILQDKYAGDTFVEIKGRQNYWCYYDPSATCDIGMCRRIPDYECDRLAVCTYYMQKAEALVANATIMSFAYFVLEGRVQTDYSFGNRDLLILDEAHSLAQHLVNHVDLTISPYTLPFETYEEIGPLLAREPNTIAEVRALVSTILTAVDGDKEHLVQLNLLGEELTKDQARSGNKLETFKMNAERFLETSDKTEWVWSSDWTSYRSSNYRILKVQPLYARFFAKDMIWNRANRFIISSAIFPSPKDFVREVGLDISFRGSEIKHIKVPSTFPVENRPIIDSVNGKLTYKYKNENMGWAIRILETVLDDEEGKNIAVHCVSYSNAAEIADRLNERFRDRLIIQTPETRKDDLEEFQSSRGMVFLCVAFTEGVDWIGDMCEAQVLFKVPYMNIGDRRVARRLQKKEWKWYRLEALKQVVQAYGRAVRSPEDKAKFYVIDESFVDLIKRSRRDLPEWFADALPPKWKKMLGI